MARSYNLDSTESSAMRTRRGIRRESSERHAVDRSVHRRRAEGVVHERAEVGCEDQRLEQVWREADHGDVKRELRQDIARHRHHRDAAVEQLLLLEVALLVQRQARGDVEWVEAKVTRAAVLRVLVELEALRLT